MPYLNVEEVESALEAATSAPYDTFTKLIPLPEKTWENRRCHAIKIASGGGSGRPGVFFLGGIHADEWGSPDILVNFIEQLEQAYFLGADITLGEKRFSAADIRAIVDTLDIYVFPQANPDGRHYSQTTDPAWRKNRRPADQGSNCVGVDLNRNFDFLWDFDSRVAASSRVRWFVSTDPCDDTYQGPAPFSEAETRNVRWIHDLFPNIGYFVDLHSGGERILHSWGDDDNQSDDPDMSFQNDEFDGVRGLRDALDEEGAYGEFTPIDDLASAQDLARAVSDAIYAVEPARNKQYWVDQGFKLYPTVGTSDDYSYSRHFVDSGNSKVLAFTIEWGDEPQPPYNEMEKVSLEITSGLLAFCLAVCNSV